MEDLGGIPSRPARAHPSTPPTQLPSHCSLAERSDRRILNSYFFGFPSLFVYEISFCLWIFPKEIKACIWKCRALCVFDRYRFGKDPICTVRGGGGGEAQNSLGKVFVGSKPESKNGARKTEAPAAEPGHLDSQSPFVCQEYRAPLPETGGKDAPRARP